MWYNIFMTNVSTQHIPSFIKPFLWSYDVSKLDLKRDKKLIIRNVLNLGTKEATDWLFSVYDKGDIRSIVATAKQGELSNKSLRFWRLILDIHTPIEQSRFV